jgi:N-methylhydantoinase A
MVDVHTVGSGGGSIGWIDHGGALRAGPRSAGADPGPACYGRGGAEPTVTDANLALGYLDVGSSLAGGVRLEAEAARAALERLGATVALDELETAEGIVRVANQEMARAVRVVTVERGIDPRDFALMPFGGAGPMHAAALADELGIRRILCPRASGVLSALGLVASERRRDTARTVLLGADELSPERLASEVADLRKAIGAGMDGARAEAEFDLRYRGQAFELTVPGAEELDPIELVEQFEAEHERRYGHRGTPRDVELVNVRLALSMPGPKVRPAAAGAGELTENERPARFAGEWHRTRIVRGEPPAGFEAQGPCIFELGEATLVLPPRWRASVDAQGTVVAEMERQE